MITILILYVGVKKSWIKKIGVVSALSQPTQQVKNVNFLNIHSPKFVLLNFIILTHLLGKIVRQAILFLRSNSATGRAKKIFSNFSSSLISNFRSINTSFKNYLPSFSFFKSRSNKLKAILNINNHSILTL